MTKDDITTTAEELAKMTTKEKVKRYAEDVMKTEKQCTEDDHSISYRYDFLLGGGSLGYPYGKPSPVGKAVVRIANKLDVYVWWNMENSYANFSGKITHEAIEQEFYPIWEESDRMKAEAGLK